MGLLGHKFVSGFEVHTIKTSGYNGYPGHKVTVRSDRKESAHAFTHLRIVCIPLRLGFKFSYYLHRTKRFIFNEDQSVCVEVSPGTACCCQKLLNECKTFIFEILVKSYYFCIYAFKSFETKYLTL
jgi:hypothetical protein